MFVFFLLVYGLFGVFGVCILPKWLIKVPGRIPILFKWFRELRKFGQNLGPDTSQLLPTWLNEYKKIWNHPGKYYLGQYWTHKISKMSKNVCPMYNVFILFRFDCIFCFLKNWVSHVILYFILYVTKMRIKNDYFPLINKRRAWIWISYLWKKHETDFL